MIFRSVLIRCKGAIGFCCLQFWRDWRGAAEADLWRHAETVSEDGYSVFGVTKFTFEAGLCCGLFDPSELLAYS